MKTPNTFVIISICYIQKGKTDMNVYRAEVIFFISIEEMDFFSLVLLFWAVLLVTVLFLFQKAAINNTLISKVGLGIDSDVVN